MYDSIPHIRDQIFPTHGVLIAPKVFQPIQLIKTKESIAALSVLMLVLESIVETQLWNLNDIALQNP